MLSSVLTSSLVLASVVSASPLGTNCVGEIRSIADVAEAKKCTTINIYSFTVPTATSFDMTKLLAGTTVNLLGDVTWTGGVEWEGPMFTISGVGATFEGNSHTFDGQGRTYWDTLGGNGGKIKPKFVRVTMDGVFRNLNILNSPKHVFSIGNKKKLVVSAIHIDNSAGNELAENGETLGHNSDCFDVSATDVVIKDSICNNQDDCLAINNADQVVFQSNTCIGGHGVSIGSIAANKAVTNVKIINNNIIRNTNGLRIKTISGATNATVSNIEYRDNTVSEATEYGVVIRQDYLNGGPTGIPTDGATISNIVFSGSNNVAVAPGADQLLVLCGNGTCTGNWDWSGLHTSGGQPGSATPADVPITGYTKP